LGEGRFDSLRYVRLLHLFVVGLVLLKALIPDCLLGLLVFVGWKAWARLVPAMIF